MGAEWLWATACDLGRGIDAGEIDPEALADTYLGAIKAHGDAARIYSALTEDRARAEAAAASRRAKAGQRRSKLDGVPISWKDLYDTAGTRTEAGSALLHGRIPSRDSVVLENATHAGLVCLGKTHMSELAFSGLGLNPVTATPPNVHDPRLVPGGSSSGAAASVAFGLAAGGVGSDTGGSVRIPSAWNDLVGLKTTPGRLSLEGVVPLCARFDTVGPLCRSVEDAGALLAALEGGKAPDLSGATLRGTRLAVLRSVAMGEGLRDAPRAAFESAVGRLMDAGAEIERIDVPEVEMAMALSGVLYTVEAYGTWRKAIEADPDLMFDRIRDRFRAGANFSGADYVEAWQKLDLLRVAYAKAVAGHDAVIMPTAPILPPDAARLMGDEDYFVAENLLALRNTRIGNLMGLCGLTLPTGVPACGILFNGLPGSEEWLLRLGKAAEAALA